MASPRTSHLAPLTLASFAALLSACAGGTAAEDTATTDTLETSDGPGDGDGDPTVGDGDPTGDGDPGGLDFPVGPDLVEVSHEREFRGVWVATVFNINWPSNSGLDVAAAQAELLDIIETCEAINLNAIVFQIRPE